MSCSSSSVFRGYYLCGAASLRRRPDRGRAATGSCMHLLRGCWNIYIPTHPFTKLWQVTSAGHPLKLLVC